MDARPESNDASAKAGPGRGHDGGEADAPRLPELTQGLLDAGTVDRYFADLEACAELEGILVKASAQAMVGGQPPTTLSEARALVHGGTVRGVQIRYRYDGSDWCDTLMPSPQGVRLVRLRQE